MPLDRRQEKSESDAGAGGASRGRVRALGDGRLEWIAVLFAVLALLTLAIAPSISSARVRHLRYTITEVSEPARVLVNDIKSELSTQMFALGEIAQGDRGRGTARYGRSVSTEMRDEVALDSLVRLSSPEVIERFTKLRTLADRWHASVAVASDTSVLSPTRAALPSAGPSAMAVRDAEAALSAASELDSLLAADDASLRLRMRTIERSDALLAAALAPIALAAMLAVVWTGRRSRRFAREAEEGRRSLARAMETKAALLRGVTHDVKNPLGAVAGYAELLEDGISGTLTAAQLTIVGRIHRLVGVSLQTLDDLLELWHSESGQLRVERVDTDLTALVRQVTEDFTVASDRAEIALVCADGAPVVAATDPTRVRQILHNLLSNAIKYTPAGGRIDVRLTTLPTRRGEAPDIAIEVADTGPGVPKELRERIFEEFFRVPDSAGKAPGTGLGLAIARRLARMLGGDIVVNDGATGGSVFRFTVSSAALSPAVSHARATSG